MALTDPVPSTEVDVLDRNVQDFDRLLNTAGFVTNRVGASLPTWAQAIAEKSFFVPVAFASGLNVSTSAFTVTYLGNTYFAAPEALPFVTTGTFNPAQWRLIIPSSFSAAAIDTDPVGGVGGGSVQVELQNLHSEIDANQLLNVQKSGGNLAGPVNANKGADIPAAANVDLGAATGEYVVITGSATITSFGTAQAGTLRTVRFTGDCTLTHSANLILPYATNVIASADDTATFRSEGGGVWRCTSCLDYGAPVAKMQQLAAVSLSGTAVNITGIPSWCKEIELSIAGMSTSGTSGVIVQGGAGSYDTTGYIGGAHDALGSSAGSTVSGVPYTSGFPVMTNITAAGVYTVKMCISFTQSTAVMDAVGRVSGGAQNIILCSGFKNTSGAWTQLRLTTTGGTDTFDAGSLTVTYKGY